jgi:hypothetical protein
MLISGEVINAAGNNVEILHIITMKYGISHMIPKQTTIFHVEVAMVAKSENFVKGMFKRDGNVGNTS